MPKKASSTRRTKKNAPAAKKASTKKATAKKASGKKKSAEKKKPSGRPAASPFAAFPATATPVTGTFLDALPRTAERDDEGAPAGAWIHRASDPTAMVTIVYEAQAEQPGLFQSFGGTPTHEETDVLDFGGKRRYMIRNNKIRGVARDVLRRNTEPESCSHEDPCGTCTPCALFGHRAQGGDGRSRAVFLDAWSIEAHTPYIESSRTVRGNPFLRQAQVAPAGTRFLGAFNVRAPSLDELADVTEAVEIAMTAGIGARTTTHGTLSFRPLAVMGGIWKRFSTPRHMLERIDTGASVEAAVATHLEETSQGLPWLTGSDAAAALEALAPLSPMSPRYGNAFMRSPS